MAWPQSRTSPTPSPTPSPEMDEDEEDEEHSDEATDVNSYGLCMLEMATAEYPYSECSRPAEIYKKVFNGVQPKSLEKVKGGEVREIIEQCMELRKEDRRQGDPGQGVLFRVNTSFSLEALAFELTYRRLAKSAPKVYFFFLFSWLRRL